MIIPFFKAKFSGRGPDLKSKIFGKLFCIGAISAALLIALTMTVFFATRLPQLSAKYALTQFFPKNHPILVDDDAVTKSFALRQSSGFSIIVDLPHASDVTWLAPEHLARLRSISDQLRLIKGVSSVLSIANVETAIDKDGELRIGTIEESLPPAQWASYVESQTLLNGQLVSKDHRSALLIVEPTELSSAAVTEVEKGIREVLAKEGKGLNAGIAGVPAIQTRLSDKLATEVGRFLVLSLIVFIGMFAAFYRNRSAIIFASVGLIVSNVCVIGALAFFGIPFSVLLSTLPIMVSIAFVSLAIHTLHLWAERREQIKTLNFHSRWYLSMSVLKEIFVANLLGSLTTAIGFATLAMAAIPAIQNYAMVVSCSVMATFVIANFLFVIGMAWVEPTQRDWISRRAWWTITVTRKATPIAIGIAVFTVIMGVSGVKVDFSSRLFDDLPRHEEVRDTMERIEAKFGGVVDLDLTLDAGQDRAWANAESFSKLKTAMTQLRALSGVGSAVGATDFAGSKFPETNGAVSELFFLYSLSPADPLRHFVDNEFRRTRIAMRIPDLPSDQVDHVRTSAKQIVLANFPGVTIVESGLALRSHTINREVAKELVFGFWQSLVIIGLVLAVIFRSLRWALIACIPNLVPPAILLGALAILGTPVKPSIALIFSIALGLAFNNTVYLLSRLRREAGKAGSLKNALQKTLLEEGHPCLSESIVMFAGFVIFLSSDFRLNQVFGGYMVLSIVAGALGDLIFLPALLKLFPGMWASPTKVVPSILNRKSQAAALVGAMLLTGLAPARAGANEAFALLKKARSKIESKSDQANVTLKIIEANGDVKSRSINLKSLNDAGTYRAIARITAPADVKGTAVLSEISKGTENQWLYLPSSQQVRRVVSGGKSGGVLGSELNPQDLNVEVLKGAKARIISKDAEKAIIEITPKANDEFTSATIELSMPDNLPSKIEYKNGGKVKKTVEFKNYTSQGNVHRPQLITIRNLANGRGTDVQFSDLKINKAIPKDEFTMAALKSE